MGVKKGYKQTDVGEIPNDWSVLRYGRIFKFLKTATYSRSQLSNNGDIKYIHYGDIHTLWNHFLDVEKSILPSISKEQIRQYSIVEEGDVIMADASEDYSGIGKSVEVKQVNSIKVISGLHTFLLRDVTGIFADGYRGYIHSIGVVKKQFDQLATGMKVYGVSKTNLKAVLIPVPPMTEQTAIATTLSSTDALISNLEQLIAKKQFVKQGAMQVLFKAKADWKIKALGEIGIPYGGLTGKSKPDFQNGNYPYIPFMNILNNPVIDVEYLDYVKIKNGEKQNIAMKGDLFFNGSSETPEDVGMCSVLLKDVPNLYLNSFCFGFRLKRELNINGLYLSYFFRSAAGRKILYSSAQGATRYNLSKSNFLKLEIHLPQSIEQDEIATILSDMDKEISHLKEKLEKMKQMKQGMMQELLTGKIRLI